MKNVELILTEGNAYTIHYMMTNHLLSKAIDLADDHKMSIQNVSTIISALGYDADFGNLINYHPVMVALTGYFDYWYAFVSSKPKLSSSRVMPEFSQWIDKQSGIIPSEVSSLANFVFYNHDDDQYQWKSRIIEEVFRHFKDFTIAFTDEQFIGKMPNCSVNDVKHCVDMFEDPADYAHYFPELNNLFAYFGYWVSNNRHSNGRKKMLTVQFPEWLRNYSNANSLTLSLCDDFIHWYPKRKIVKGRNYDNWGYNV